MLMRTIFAIAVLLLTACETEGDASVGDEARSSCEAIYDCFAEECLVFFNSRESACQPCEPGPIPCSPNEGQQMRCDSARADYAACLADCRAPHVTDPEFTPFDPPAVALSTFETCATDSALECEQAEADCKESNW